MTAPDENAGWIPSRRALWMLVAIVAISAVAAGFLERGLGGEPLAEFDHLDTDVGAFYELADRRANPCPAVGDPVVPADLADGLVVTCKPYDTEGGFMIGVAVLGVAVLGAVIVMTSGNRFGTYLVLLAVVLMVGSGIGETYSVRALLLRPGSLPLGEVVAFIMSPTWVVAGVLLVPRMILVFPTGRLPSRRWRWVMRATYLPAALLIISQYLQPFWVQDYPNPLPFRVSRDFSFVLFDIGILGWIALINVAFAGLLWRFVTARGEERQQLKWVAYAAGVGLVVNLIATFVPQLEGTVQQITNFGILPVVVLLSIFKFRLYDIDRIINRTVVYGLVTVVVAALFGALIVLPQTLLVGSQGLDAGFVVIVAIATLLVAALFNPLRRRVQLAVDRRFDRTRYDAEQVVAVFQDRLTEPRELPALVEDVSEVVSKTMVPSQVGVWTPSDSS